MIDSDLIEYVRRADLNENDIKDAQQISAYQPKFTEQDKITGVVWQTILGSQVQVENFKHGVYIPSVTMPPYIINIGDGILVGVTFLPRVRQTSNEYLRPLGFPEGDINGRGMFSTVQMRVGTQHFDKLQEYYNQNTCPNHGMHKRASANSPLKENVGGPVLHHDVSIDLAVAAINIFIEKYKVLNDGYFMNSITKTATSPFRVTWRGLNGKTLQSNTVTTILYSPYSESVISNENNLKLRKMLELSLEIDMIERLDVEIRRRLELQEWRLAIIESAIMFESWIQPIIRGYYLKLLGSKTKVDKKLSYIDIEGKTHPTSIGDILKYFIKEAFKFDFEKTPEYIALTSKTISPRNKIVHGTPFIATKQTAIDAYLSAKAAIQKIREYTPA